MDTCAALKRDNYVIGKFLLRKYIELDILNIYCGRKYLSSLWRRVSFNLPEITFQLNIVIWIILGVTRRIAIRILLKNTNIVAFKKIQVEF